MLRIEKLAILSALVFIAMTILCVQVGCASKAHPRVESMTLDPIGTGPVAIDIQNTNGSVEVIIDKRLAAPIIEAQARGSVSEREKRGKDGGAWFAHEFTSDEGRPVLRVLASDPTDRGVAIDLKVKSPSCAGLRVRNARGSVRVRNAAGAVEINNGYSNGGTSAEGGDVLVSFSDVISGPVTILTTNGHIDLSLPAESGGVITAMTLEGRVSTSTPGATVKNSKYTETKWSGILNGGEHPVQVHTARGNVDLTVRRPTPADSQTFYWPF